MKPRRSKWAVFAVGAVLCGIAAYASTKVVSCTRKAREQNAELSRQQVVKKSVDALLGVKRVKIADDDSWKTAMLASATSVSADDQEDAFDASTHAIEFLIRLNDPSSDFHSWLVGLGYRYRSADDLVNSCGINIGYEYFVGKKLPDDWASTRESFVHELREAILQRSDSRIVAIGSDPIGFDVKMAVRRPENPTALRTGGLFETCRPVGAPASTTPGCVVAPVNTATLLSKGLSARCAVVGVVAEFDDGTVRPVWVELVKDQPSRKWFVESVTHSTFYSGDSSAIRFPW